MHTPPGEEGKREDVRGDSAEPKSAMRGTEEEAGRGSHAPKPKSRGRRPPFRAGLSSRAARAGSRGSCSTTRMGWLRGKLWSSDSGPRDPPSNWLRTRSSCDAHRWASRCQWSHVSSAETRRGPPPRPVTPQSRLLPRPRPWPQHTTSPGIPRFRSTLSVETYSPRSRLGRRRFRQFTMR